MPVSIQSARFSFIRFEQVEYYLPAYRLFAEAFQFLVIGFLPITSKLKLGVINSAGEQIDVFPAPIYASILSYRLKIPNVIHSAANFYLASISINAVEKNYYRQVTYGAFKQIMYDDFGVSISFEHTLLTNKLSEIIINHAPNNVTELTPETLQNFWGRGYVSAAGNLIIPFFTPGECFQYVILDEISTVIGTTNRFKMLAKDRHTSLLTYSNHENAFEFVYNNNRQNIVRLPFYLSRPQWPEKKNVYIKSNGEHKLLSAFIEEQYTLKTEHMPAKLHRFLKMALAHDQVIIDCPHLEETPVEVINTDSYQPAWDDEVEIDSAQGTCIVTVATFGYRNDNCETEDSGCTPPIVSLGANTNTTQVFNFSYPPGAVQFVINYRKFGMQAWQNVVINAAPNYTLTGLDAGSNYEIRVASNCGDGFGEFSGIKPFYTTGDNVCQQPTSLHFLAHEPPVTNGTTGVFTFEINMPDIPSTNMQLTIQRPDGFIEQFTVDASGYTTNPFQFTYEGNSVLQPGIYRFKARSDCGAGEYSLYSNEATFNNQQDPVDVIIEYDFTKYFGSQGTFELLRNGISIFQTSSNAHAIVRAEAGDFITVIVTSTGSSSANLHIRETVSNTNTYDSPGTNQQEIFDIPILENQYHSITANIGGT